MKEFEDFLGQCGLKMVAPEKTSVKKALLMREKQLTDYSLGDGIMWMVVFGFSIKIDDIDKVYQTFSIPEEYNLIKPLLKDRAKIHLSMQNKDEKFYHKTEWQVEFNYDDFENEILGNPSKHGINDDEIKLMKMFGTGEKRLRKEVDVRYDKIMDFVSVPDKEMDAKMEWFADEYLRETNGKEMGAEWLKMKMEEMQQVD